MSHSQAQSILEDLKVRNNLQAIQIKTSSLNFNSRFNYNVSSFFRSLKNGLYSFQGTSNRIYFKGLSGVYFSESNEVNLEIIIVYDSSITSLNHLQIKTRIKKLLGLEVDISIGNYNDYSYRIIEMTGNVREIQTFGSWYFNR